SSASWAIRCDRSSRRARRAGRVNGTWPWVWRCARRSDTTMKDIDFLPAKYQEATAQLHAQWWRMAVLAMFAALVGLAVFGQYGIRLHAQGEIETLLPQYHAALAEMQRLAKTEDAVRPNRAQAELLTYLRHPWPRTQILARIMAPLPDT